MMTPLLFCVNRGYMEIVRQLIDMGADRNCSDKNVSCGVACVLLYGAPFNFGDGLSSIKFVAICTTSVASLSKRAHCHTEKL
jgi:hypothetical protein